MVLVHAVEHEQVLAVALEGREHVCEDEVRLAARGEALADLIAVGREDEDDAPRWRRHALRKRLEVGQEQAQPCGASQHVAS